MPNASDELITVSIRRDGRKTNVSLDMLLYEWLSYRHGGIVGAQAWIRRAVYRIEALRDAGDPLVMVGKIGFSRLIQRLIVKELIDAAGGIGREFGDGHLRGQAALVDALKRMDEMNAVDGGGDLDDGDEVVTGVAA